MSDYLDKFVIEQVQALNPEMCSGSEAGSYLRPIDSCIPQIQAQGPSRTCDESKEEEEDLGKFVIEQVQALNP